MELGGADVPAVGFAMGVERMLNALDKKDEPQGNESGIFVASMGSQAVETCFGILHNLRNNGFSANGTLNNQSLKSQMRLANSQSMRYCIIVGENELKDKTVALKDLKKQSQETVQMDKLIEHLKKEYGKGAS